MIIQSTRVWIDESFKKAAIEIRDGKITGIYPHGSREGAIDYGKNRILPGLIDVHCHGYHGMTCNEVTKDNLKKYTNLIKRGIIVHLLLKEKFKEKEDESKINSISNITIEDARQIPNSNEIEFKIFLLLN